VSSQSIRKPGAVCQNIIGPAGLAVSAVKDPLSEPFPGPPWAGLGRESPQNRQSLPHPKKTRTPCWLHSSLGQDFMRMCPTRAYMCHRGRLGWSGTFGLKQNRCFQSLADTISRSPNSGEREMRRHLPSFEGPGCA
jgi:hypothetical protein